MQPVLTLEGRAWTPDGEVPLDTRHLCDCGHPQGTGCCPYARTNEGKTRCPDCANKAEQEHLKTADRMGAYYVRKGQIDQISSFFGARLMFVLASWEACHGYCGRVTYLRAVDIYGRYWHGTSPGPGMYCRMHRSKTK